MSEMVERVAQAICGDDNPDNILEFHRTRARAALEAMRAPTSGMLSEGCQIIGTVINSMRVWQAMIDEALK